MRYPRFNGLGSRLKTFDGWKHLADPMELSKSGLFYLGGGDQVQCFHCAIVLHTWKTTDKADFEHLRHSPSCSFIRNKCSDMYRFPEELMISMLQSIQEQNTKIRSIQIEMSQLYRSNAEDCIDRIEADIPMSRLANIDANIDPLNFDCIDRIGEDVPMAQGVPSINFVM